MRSVFKIGAPVLAAALALSACGGTTGGGSAAGGGKACDLKIGFFGALTGDAANLGINIKNGADLAVRQYNDKNPTCKVTLVVVRQPGRPVHRARTGPAGRQGQQARRHRRAGLLR